MEYSNLHLGLGYADAALTINRLALGTFFTISGANKLFHKERHAALVETLKMDRVPCVPVFQWAVPSVEFFGGIALFVGLLSPLAAFGLLVICGVATCVDGLKRIPAMKPINQADKVDDLLYLPEVLYMLMLFSVIVAGPGTLSIDHLIFGTK